MRFENGWERDFVKQGTEASLLKMSMDVKGRKLVCFFLYPDKKIGSKPAYAQRHRHFLGEQERSDGLEIPW